MIIAIDIETYKYNVAKEQYEAILDSTEFLCGNIHTEKGKHYFFTDQKKMWIKILQLAMKAYRAKKVLNVYAHNAQYDFFGVVPPTLKNLKYESTNPFIVKYEIEGKTAIKFLDTYSIYGSNLKDIGTMVGIEKQELQHIIKAPNKEISYEDWNKLREYNQRDTEITLQAILHLKKRLQNEGINIRRLHTKNQIAIQYLLNKIKEFEQTENIEPKTKYLQEQSATFFDKAKNQVWNTKYKEEIHAAYKGGRVEAFKTGMYDNCYSVDINSLYPYASIKMRYPDLRSEIKIDKPLKNKGIIILAEIGISKAMVKNETDEIGLLPIRKEEYNYYPKKGSIMIGTWTNQELSMAMRNGYKIIDIEYSIIWNESKNPFKSITPTLYNKKKYAENKLERWYYKNLMNCSYGKLAQTKIQQEMVFDSIEKAEEYVAKGWVMMQGTGFDVLYKRNKKGQRQKSYYAPIIPTLINAWSRIYLYRYLKKINPIDLLYCDTDSIKFRTQKNLQKFTIGEEIGEWKLEEEKQDMIIYGAKTYSIGNKIKISGFRKKNITIQNFRKGLVTSQKMITIKTFKTDSEIGKFITEIRDLEQQEKKYVEQQDQEKKTRLHIDKDIKDVEYFMNTLKYLDLNK